MPGKSQKENVMRTLYATLFSLIITAAQAYAAAGAVEGEGVSLLAIGFISFGVLILLFQFVPALLLIGGMVVALFKTTDKKSSGLASADKIA